MTTADTRDALIAEHEAVLKEYAAQKDAVRIASRDKAPDVKDQQRRLAQLKKREQQIRQQLGKLTRSEKSADRRRQYRREELFVDVVRRRFGEETYREIWAEVDRLERDQWRATWTTPGPATP